MYLLDSDILIYNLKGHPKVARHLDEHLLDPIKISVITLMELYYGAYKSQKIEVNLAKVGAIEEGLEVISVQSGVADVFGRLKSLLEKRGNRLDDFDLIIAATALAYNLTVVTNNEKHFRHVDDLRVENWTV